MSAVNEHRDGIAEPIDPVSIDPVSIKPQPFKPESINPQPIKPQPINPVSNWNLANGLTGGRLILVPFFALALFHGTGHEGGWRIIAWGVFALASATDSFDGELARRRGTVTEFGKLADPIADKALTGTALVGLSVLGNLAWWVTIVVLVREVGVTLLRLWVIRHGVIPASRGGKVKTLLQGVAIGLFILPLPGHWHDIAVVIMVAAVVMTIATGLDYIARAIRLRQAGRAAQQLRRQA